jgi:hypothetical protein
MVHCIIAVPFLSLSSLAFLLFLMQWNLVPFTITWWYPFINCWILVLVFFFVFYYWHAILFTSKALLFTVWGFLRKSVDVQILKEFVDWSSSEWAVLMLSMGRDTCNDNDNVSDVIATAQHESPSLGLAYSSSGFMKLLAKPCQLAQAWPAWLWLKPWLLGKNQLLMF